MRLIRRPRWFLLAILLLPLLVYPAYIAVTAILGYLLGDGLLMRDILYGSRGELLLELRTGWINSIPPAAGLFFLALLPLWFLLRRFPWLYYLFVLLGSAVPGYYFLPDEILAVAAASLSLLIMAMITDRVLRLFVRKAK